MPTLPSASLTINEASGAFAAGKGYAVVMACVSQSADFVPRVVSSAQDLLDQYKYSPGVSYCASHFAKTKKPIIFVGLPVTTDGTIGRQNSSGVTGSSAITVTADTGGVFEETSGVVTVVKGGTVGTDQLSFDLSLDGGISTQRVRLGTAVSYTIPFVGLVLNFGAGTLNADDVFTFTTTAPMWGSTAMASARATLAAQQNPARTWLVVGDVPNSTFAGYVTTEANNYETENDRFTSARAQVPDRLPLASKSDVIVKTVGATVTFAGTGHTATRSAGSWITDGFAVGDVVTFAGSASNNGSKGAITVLTATVMTFASGLTDEGPVADVSATGSEGFTFAASGHTITRSRGSWLADGFAVGDTPTAAGTASNNITFPAITVLTATVMTFGSGVTNEGPIASSAFTFTKGQTVVAWVSAQTAAFATVDGEKRISLGLGRARHQCPITGWTFRRPAQWAASIREYQHDVQIPTYRKDDGKLEGFDITDATGNTVEFDETLNGGGLAGRFTCLRSYGNGPAGAFVALDLTRDSEGALLSRSQNMAVANVACTTTQRATEQAIGQVLQLNDDGTGTSASLSQLEKRVNKALQNDLLQQFSEGPRASSAKWTASRTDNLSEPGATLNGNLALNLNGTLENIATSVAVS